jgi:cell wall-associated NlpC family hydrolase
MAGEVPRRQRIKPARLAPADLVFFGPGGPRAKPPQIDHMGLYLGNGWLIHSSRYGVALARIDGWYEDQLAWGRRPLAEAGL